MNDFYYMNKAREAARNSTEAFGVPEKPKALQTQIGGAHFTDMVIQPIECIQANRIPFPEVNVIKYVTRWMSKGGIKDLRKAAFYLEMLIEYEEGLLSSHNA